MKTAFYLLRFPRSLQYTIPVTVLMVVATMAGPMTAMGSTLPYWLRYAMIFTGISCSEEIFNMRKSHISLLAVPGATGTCLLYTSHKNGRKILVHAPA